MLTTEIVDIQPGTQIDTLTTLTVAVEIVSDEPEVVTLNHRDSAVYLDVCGPDGNLLLTMDEGLSRRMVASRTLREWPEPMEIEAGRRYRLEFELCRFYYPLREGRYQLVPCFRSPSSDGYHGRPFEITVAARPVEQVIEWYQNPIFGSHSLLVQSRSGDKAPQANVSWLGLNQPRATYFNESIPKVPDGAVAVVSLPAFFDLDDFTPGFERTLLWLTDSEMHMMNTNRGVPTGPPRILPRPTPAPLLPYSFRLDNGRIYIFSAETSGAGIAFRGYYSDIRSAGFTMCLDHKLNVDPDSLLSVAGGPDTIYLVAAGKKIEQFMFELSGGELGTSLIEECPGRPLYLFANLAADFIRAAYAHPADPRYVTLVESPFASVNEPRVDPWVDEMRLPLQRGEQIREIDFITDSHGRAQLVYSTTNGRLVCCDSSGVSQELAVGEERYFPRLLAGDIEFEQPFVGFYRRTDGYRFYSTEGDGAWDRIRKVKV